MANCTKIKYTSPQAATLAMMAIVLRDAERRPKVPVAVYPCEKCHAWHLTSKKQSGKPRWWNMDLNKIRVPTPIR